MKRAICVAAAVGAVALFPASASAVDGSPVPTTSGGGWIVGVAGFDKASFGVLGLVQPDGSFAGNLEFTDHGVGFSIKSTRITNYFAECTSGVSQIEGTARTHSGVPVDFIVVVDDSGEPGINSDTFTIVAEGYANSGVLMGGDIQLTGCP